MNTLTTPSNLQDELRLITSRSLSTRSRYLHVALLLAASAMGVLIAALLLTEPALPMRTQGAFICMLAIAIGWVVYVTWVLRKRQPLMAQHRVVAGRMAVAFSGVFLAGSAALYVIEGTPMFLATTAMGLPMFLLAIGLMLKANARRAHLLTRRQQLESALSASW